jgi:hypothetical protein
MVQFYDNPGWGNCNCINVLFWGSLWRFLCTLEEKKRLKSLLRSLVVADLSALSLGKFIWPYNKGRESYGERLAPEDYGGRILMWKGK